jgi:hypothetical protein
MHRNNFTWYLVYLHLTTGIRLYNSDTWYKFLQPGNKTMVNLNSNKWIPYKQGALYVACKGLCHSKTTYTCTQHHKIKITAYPLKILNENSNGNKNYSLNLLKLQTPVPNTQWKVSRWSEHDIKQYSSLPHCYKLKHDMPAQPETVLIKVYFVMVR